MAATEPALAGRKRASGPFDLDNDHLYRRWRDWKLAGYPTATGNLVVEVKDPRQLGGAERAACLERLRKTNMALIVGPESITPEQGKDFIRAVGSQFGLQRLNANMCADDDGITPLTVIETGQRVRYIPYTNRPIRWHTDGYYNTLDEQINGLLLYCVQDAATGGENALMDHEVAYILLRNAEPAYIAALMHPHAMTIPANTEGEVEIREARTGPVFSVDPLTGTLHMRYTMRARNVIWRDDAVTREAVAFLENLLEGHSPYIFRHRMTPGQGLVSNNVLHDRAGFADDPAAGKKRLIFRARYFDRISHTSLADIWPEASTS